MAAFAGRDFRIKYDSGAGAVVIAGAQTDSFTINKTVIDITDKDDNGIQTLLNDYGKWSCSLSCSGILVGTQLSTLMASNSTSQLIDMQIEWGASLGTWVGSFFITDFETSGEDGDSPATFSCNLTSSGNVAVTP